jgi:hypothetical protein
MYAICTPQNTDTRLQKKNEAEIAVRDHHMDILFKLRNLANDDLGIN